MVKEVYSKMTTFKTNKHEGNTVKINKVKLDCYDDKRITCEDGSHTKAIGSISE